MCDVYRPLNYLSLLWYKKSGAGNASRTRIIADNIKYVISQYGRVLTVREPTRRDSAVYQCEAVFTRPGARSSSSSVAEAVLTVYGQYIVSLVICALFNEPASLVYSFFAILNTALCNIFLECGKE